MQTHSRGVQSSLSVSSFSDHTEPMEWLRLLMAVSGTPRLGAQNPRLIACLNRPADWIRLINFIELGSSYGSQSDVNRRGGVTQACARRSAMSQKDRIPARTSYGGNHDERRFGQFSLRAIF